MTYSYEYPRAAVAVDCVVFGLDENDLKVLLIQRKLPPFQHAWALPGGFVRMDETLELTAEADKLGAAAALVVTPYYGRAQQEGLFQWYSTVAREFPNLGIIVYNVPVRAAVDITPATVGRLRRAHDNIIGIKETTRDFEHVSYVLNECGTDFIALSGIELLCYPMLCLGGVGHLSCVGNFAPRPIRP